MIEQFCVYRHIRLDKNVPFYVGKGKNNRAWSKLRNNYWHRIVNKYGYRVEIIKEGISEKEALLIEFNTIKMYKSLGYCEANLTNGGKGGLSGFSHSDQTKKLIGESKKGKKFPNLSKSATGRILSESMKLKISTTLGSKLVRVLKDGKIIGRWINLNKCAKDLNLYRPNITHCLKGRIKTTGGYTFKEVSNG